MPSSPTRVPAVYRWLSSLRSQLVLMLLLASLVPVLAIVFFPRLGLYDLSRSTLEDTVGTHLHEVAKELQARATEPAQARLDNVVGLARDVQPYLAEMMRHDPADLYRAWRVSGQSLSQRKIMALRRMLTDRAPRVVHYVIADARGLLLMSGDLHAPFDVSEESWWIESVENRAKYIGKTAYDDANDSVMLSISVPVREGDRILGAIYAVFAMPELGRLARTASPGGSNRERDIVIMGRDSRDDAVYMVASSTADWRDLRDGDRVWLEVDGHPEWSMDATVALDVIDLPTGSSISVTDKTVSELEGEIADRLAQEGNLEAPPITRLAVKKALLLYSRAAEEATRGSSVHARRPYSVEKDGYGSERVYGLAPPTSSVLPWSVVVSEPTRLAFTSSQALRKRVLWVVGVVIAGLGVTSVVFARRLVAPLRQITDAAQVIRRGDYQQAIPITMNNEIGVLVEEFNEMTGTVQDALGRLTREEKKLSSVLNSIAEGIVYLDLDRRVVLTNPAAAGLLGLPDDAVGKVVDELLEADVVERLFSGEHRARRRAKSVTSEVSLTVDGQTRALKVVSSAVLGGDDSPVGAVFVLDDITREKEIEQMKSDFVALVSHELRTPLTSIYGYTRLILDGKTGEVPALTLDKLVRVERQALRLSHLITDLLDLSRIESGRMEMRMAPTSIVEVVATRIDDIRPQADEKQIVVTLEAADDVPDVVADGERVGQVVTNLLSNAVKFTPQGGSVRARIRLEGSLLSVQVIDTGTGIPPEERSLIFDKFHQVSSVHTRQQGGTGLGLAIAKSIVEAHGGRIWVDDGTGEGSDFRFVLPLVETKGAVLTPA